MRGLGFHVALVALGAMGAVAQARIIGQQPTQTVWRLDNLRMISGHAVKVIGDPKVVDTDIGAAIAFDGRDGVRSAGRRPNVHWSEAKPHLLVQGDGVLDTDLIRGSAVRAIDERADCENSRVETGDSIVAGRRSRRESGRRRRADRGRSCI